MRENSDYYQWVKIKSKLSQIYPTLTEADLIWRHDSIKTMLETISSKLGITVKELKENIDKF